MVAWLTSPREYLPGLPRGHRDVDANANHLTTIARKRSFRRQGDQRFLSARTLTRLPRGSAVTEELGVGVRPLPQPPRPSPARPEGGDWVYFFFRAAGDGGAGGGTSEVAMSATAFQDPSACLR